MNHTFAEKRQSRGKPGIWRTPLRVDILTCLTVAITCVASVEPGNPLRYAVYLVPLLYLWEWVIRNLRASFVQRRSARAYLVLIASLLYPAAISPHGDYQYLVLMSLGYSLLAFRVYVRIGSLVMLLAILMACQIVLLARSGMSLGNLSGFSLSGHNFKETSHTLPFLFGGLLGMFILRRRYTLASIALIGTLLGGKRIDVLAALGAVAIQWCYGFIVRRFPRSFSGDGFKMVFCGSVVSLVVAIGMEMPCIVEWLSNYYRLNINVLTQGRYTAQMSSYSYLDHEEADRFILGNGLGMADALATRSWGWQCLIHNDVLRLFIDLGALPAMVFLGCLIVMIGLEKIGIFNLSYAALMWCTDNTLIYPFFQVGLSMIILASREPDGEPEPKRQTGPKYGCLVPNAPARLRRHDGFPTAPAEGEL